MSTRNVTMVVHRSESEKYVKGFAVDPSDVADKSYVNMYLHHDGYPEYQGVQIANWIKYMQNDKGFTNFGDGSRIASHLVKDMHYNSQYLYPSVDFIDHNYTYIIWVGKSDVWVSCWNQHTNTCVFVSTPDKIIKKYSRLDTMEYTDWSYKQNNITNR
ncbi:MAG: hypothetical protein ACKVJ6_07610 [Flavobacteriales bacterium]|tara:strand:+ start:138 stop:611 length:474 start_codon:yes stop_codon:yes gene_type:complete